MSTALRSLGLGLGLSLGLRKLLERVSRTAQKGRHRERKKTIESSPPHFHIPSCPSHPPGQQELPGVLQEFPQGKEGAMDGLYKEE